MSKTSSVAGTVARRLVPLATAGVAGGGLRRFLNVAVDGVGPLPGAKAAAAAKLQKHGRVAEAIDAVITQHVQLAGLQGFATNIGGLATAAAGLPANMAGIAIIQIRMVAAIAHLQGYDIDDKRVRTAIMMCLVGKKELDKMIKSGELPARPMVIATAPVYDPKLDKEITDKAVAAISSAAAGKRAASFVTKRIPGLGGVVGAGVDGWGTRSLGTFVRGELLARRAAS